MLRTAALVGVSLVTLAAGIVLVNQTVRWVAESHPNRWTVAADDIIHNTQG